MGMFDRPEQYAVVLSDIHIGDNIRRAGTRIGSTSPTS